MKDKVLLFEVVLKIPWGIKSFVEPTAAARYREGKMSVSGKSPLKSSFVRQEKNSCPGLSSSILITESKGHSPFRFLAKIDSFTV